MDLREARRVEALDEAAQRLARERMIAVGVQPHVVAVRLDPLDIAHADEADAPRGTDGEPVEVLLRDRRLELHFVVRAAELREQRAHGAHRRAMLELHLRTYPIDRLAESLSVEGLEHVVEGAHLERTHGVFVVRRDEDDHRRVRRVVTQRLDEPEAVHLGHPHIEQHDVGPRAANQLGGLAPVRGGSDDLDVRVRGEEARELGARGGLVVGDEDAHALSRRRHERRRLLVGASDAR
jgi:hypothetical protein